jgi:hypothetical protein
MARLVNGDALRLLVLERVEQEGVLERSRGAGALLPNLLELALGQRTGVGEEPPDDRALPVIDVPADHQMNPLPGQRLGTHGRAKPHRRPKAAQAAARP